MCCVCVMFYDYDYFVDSSFVTTCPRFKRWIHEIYGSRCDQYMIISEMIVLDALWNKMIISDGDCHFLNWTDDQIWSLNVLFTAHPVVTVITCQWKTLTKSRLDDYSCRVWTTHSKLMVTVHRVWFAGLLSTGGCIFHPNKNCDDAVGTLRVLSSESYA